MKRTFLVFLLIITVIIGTSACGGSSSSSSYQLHDKDGNINWDYYNDMQDYFEKHPEKRP
ncbi:MAG: hypothetical protein IJS90_07775 [Clostridia bacterium]|nr:hypothetical protein [Clostridia bacterium]